MMPFAPTPHGVVPRVHGWLHLVLSAMLLAALTYITLCAVALVVRACFYFCFLRGYLTYLGYEVFSTMTMIVVTLLLVFELVYM